MLVLSSQNQTSVVSNQITTTDRSAYNVMSQGYVTEFINEIAKLQRKCVNFKHLSS